MIARFYIIPESFSSDNLDNSEFTSSLESFISDYNNFLDYKEENEIIIQNEIYNVVFPNGISLAEFLFTPNPQIQGKELALKKFLSNVLLKLPHEEIDKDLIKEQIGSNSLDGCYGIISLSKIDNIANENQVIYSKDSLIDFRRFHLGLFFSDAEYFIDECKKYYSKLLFHEKNYKSIAEILKGFSNKIIFHLNGLNDILPSLLIKKEFNNHTELLETFTEMASLDEIATLEGKNKDRLGFEFINDEGKSEEVICEPHMKLSKSDNSDGHYYKNRIYFSFGKENIENSKILVGHIGEHL